MMGVGRKVRITLAPAARLGGGGSSVYQQVEITTFQKVRGPAHHPTSFHPITSPHRLISSPRRSGGRLG